MKVSDHLFDSGNTSRHSTKQVILIAIVNSDVGIYRPDQYGIDTTVALLEIIEIFIYGIFSRDRIVEVTIFDHHLRLDKTGLRPLQFLAVVFLPGIARPEPRFTPPASNVVEPELVIVRGTALRWSEIGSNWVKAFRARNLIAIRRVMGILRRGVKSEEYEEQDKSFCDEPAGSLNHHWESPRHYQSGNRSGAETPNIAASLKGFKLNL